ncbi:ATP-binding protein [Wukongibacter sp. M2B1]|uniref:ATP-binding protein n=1 Tax=Wukongibacter sp. M2B1 TaxID=3088895 RepID=UPI003D79CEE9
MQLVVVSGKGGTGKTTIASSLAHLSKARIKIDCDVDASNLHLILNGKDVEENDFSGAKVAKIDPDICVECSKCEDVCRFKAISKYKVDELLCEGCGACYIACKFGAVSLKDEITGKTIVTKDETGFISRAEMEIGAEGSGRLVTEVRQRAAKYKNDDDLVILDGSPGIGCAVMASITGCDMALIVTEPTQSGFEDFTRILSVCKYFSLTPLVCINKFDINENITKEIEEFCNDEKIELVGKIPFDENIKRAINSMKPIVIYDSPAANEIKKVWLRIYELVRM